VPGRRSFHRNPRNIVGGKEFEFRLRHCSLLFGRQD
jgi:hypothetical protein